MLADAVCLLAADDEPGMLSVRNPPVALKALRAYPSVSGTDEPLRVLPAVVSTMFGVGSAAKVAP